MASVRRGSFLSGRLDDTLGASGTAAFLRAVLRLTADGLSKGRAASVLQAQIAVELGWHVIASGDKGIRLASDHAALLAALSERVWKMLRGLLVAGADDLPQSARVAARYKARADRLADLPDAALSRGEQVQRILSHAGHAVGGLEEVVRALTLVPEAAPARALSALTELADLVMTGCRDYVRTLAYASVLPRAATGDDVLDVLSAVNRVKDCQVAVGSAERAATAVLFESSHDVRELFALTAVANGFTRSADALACGVTAVRDYVLRTAMER